MAQRQRLAIENRDDPDRQPGHAPGHLPVHVPGHVPGQCPVDALLKLLMGPWTTYIVWLLETHGSLRFGEIKARMPAISSKVLTERLRHLEAARLVSRDYRPTIPPAVSYALTPRGHELKAVLDGISIIARRWQVVDSAAPVGQHP